MESNDAHKLAPSSEGKVDESGIDKTFLRTTLSYKFYWLMALIDKVVVNQELTFPALDLAVQMVAMAWLPVSKHKLGLGKGDGFKTIISNLDSILALHPESSRTQVTMRLQQKLGDERTAPIIIRELERLLVNVPYCFISPWTQVPGESYRKAVRHNLAIDTRTAPYHLELRPEGRSQRLWVVVHPSWVDYLTRYSAPLTDLALAALGGFVQERNNELFTSPDILDWRIDATIRLHQLNFWNKAIQGSESMNQPIYCLFKNEPLQLHRYYLEHFLPSHFHNSQTVWSIFPISGNAQPSRSGNHLNDLGRWLDPMARGHQQALRGYIHAGGQVDAIRPDFQQWGYDIPQLTQLPSQHFAEIFCNIFELTIERNTNQAMGNMPVTMVADDSKPGISIGQLNGTIFGKSELTIHKQ